MKRFKLVNSSNKEEFEKEVEKLLNEGYQQNDKLIKNGDEYILSFIKEEKTIKENIIYNTTLINNISKDMNDGKLIQNNPFYCNLQRYRRSNIQFNYTSIELEEINRCKKDPFYFFNNFIYILHAKYGEPSSENSLKLVLREYQIRLLEGYFNNLYNINMISRQMGGTLLVSLIMLYESIFNNKKVLLITNLLLTSVEIMDKIKSIYEYIPFYMKPGVINMSNNFMRFDNGSILKSNNRSKIIYHKEFDIVIIIDYAHIIPIISDYIKNDMIPELINNKKKILINSSVNGNNDFYKLFIDAENGNNNFIANRYYWWEIKERDDEWVKNTIKMIGEDNFNKEYNFQIK